MAQAAAASLSWGFGTQALAQPAGYPARAIRLVLPLGPGSANDAVGRLIAPVSSCCTCRTRATGRP